MSDLKQSQLNTPLGPMACVADNKALYLLEFSDSKSLKRDLNKLKIKFSDSLFAGETSITKNIKQELKDYFSGKSFNFKTPIHIIGSDFQKTVWQALMEVPLAKTRSYLDIAKSINRPTACRAVARANASNRLAIIIPCHRVINENGAIGGYAAGIKRKQWLLNHEKS
ncbi:MAG: methylated-DNA--[protein]-cysteine S-methyltransferase [Gammaproteobacteria bacterium]|nr:methylated-DNA--[protein]-cysteine S-methyltransferase [Gammaproteobacteria bacterium]